MKQFLLLLLCTFFLALSFSSCYKKCYCEEYGPNGEVIDSYEDRVPKGGGLKCNTYNIPDKKICHE